jgi:large conductance mechanosensitive channel
MSFFREFEKFIAKGNAIDMAIGVITGAAMGTVVNSLVSDVIMPPIGLLLGNVDFSQLFVTLRHGSDGLAHYNTIAQAQAAGATTLNIGVFINALVSFMIIMFAVFLILKVINKIKGPEEPSTYLCPYCLVPVANAATKCPACCSKLPPLKSRKSRAK